MPFTSQVGRDQIISSTERPFSPAGTERPTSPRNSASEKPSFVPAFAQLLRQLRHAVVEAGQRHPAVCVVKIGDDPGEDVVRIAAALP